MPDVIFISYARENAAAVKLHVQRLRDAGLTVWIDESSIDGGQLWPQTVVEAIRRCQAFVVFLSNYSIRSMTVRKEVALAMHFNIPILPLRLEPVEIPDELLFHLIEIQHVDLFDGGVYPVGDPVLVSLQRIGVTVPALPTAPANDAEEIYPVSTPSAPPPLYAPPKVGGAPAEISSSSMSVHKTLLIGLGTTGVRICRQVLDSLAGDYESFDRLPWIRCLTLDAASAEFANCRPAEKTVDVSIRRKDFTDIVSSPQQFADSIDLPSWIIPDIIRTSYGISDGSMNMRFLGRLAFFYPSNFLCIHNALLHEISSLQTLTCIEASERYARHTAEPISIQFGEEIKVIVVGSLAGGTGGGAFIDLGYLLREIAGKQPEARLETSGVFLLPHELEREEVFLGNVYASLLEYNHFADDRTIYTAKFPHLPMPWRSQHGERPYGTLYLVQSPQPSFEAYNTLMQTVAGELCSEVMSAMSPYREACRENMGAFEGLRSPTGAVRAYHTLGFSTISYPAAQFQRAFACRLLLRGLVEILGIDEIHGQENDHSPLDKMLRLELLFQKLREIDNKDLLSHIEKLLHDMTSPQDSLEAINRIVETSQAPAGSVLSPLRMSQVIKRNAPLIQEELQRSISQVVRQFISESHPGGILALRQLLYENLKKIEKLKSEVDQHEDLSRAMVDNQRGLLVEACEKVSQAGRQWLWRRCVMQRAHKEFQHLALEYCSHHFVLACVPVLREMLQLSLKWIECLIRRLQHSSVVIERIYCLRKLACAPEEDRQIQESGVIDIIAPPLDVPPADDPGYQQAVLNAAGRQYPVQKAEALLAGQAVASLRERILEGLLMPLEQRGEFDDDRLWHQDNEEILTKLISQTAVFFHAVGEPSIFARIQEGGHDLLHLLQRADALAAPLLPVPLNLPEHASKRESLGMVAFPDEESFTEQMRFQVKELGLKPLGIHHAMGIDRRQITFYRESGPFSLDQTREFASRQSRMYDAYRHPSWFNTYHSRGDIEDWISWHPDDEVARGQVRTLLLVAIALHLLTPVDSTHYLWSISRKFPTDPGTLQLSNNLDEMVSQIRVRQCDDQLFQSVNGWRMAQGTAEYVRRIDAFLRQPETILLSVERRITPDLLQAYLYDHINSDKELWAAYTALYPDVVTAEV